MHVARQSKHESRAVWRYASASVQGTSHVDSGFPCQDNALTAVVQQANDEDVLIIACADGAGSARFSQEGSALACVAVIGEVSDYLERHALSSVAPSNVEQWYLGVNATLAERAQELSAVPRDMACTLLLAVLAPDVTVFAQIGDGAIVASDEANDCYIPIFWPQSGEYANSTYFVTESEALVRLQIVVERDRTVREVALFTDGIQTIALRYDTKAAHTPFFRPMFARLRDEPRGHAAELSQALGVFLQSPKVNERTDDDKTLVLATRIPLHA
jgi:hypothetical protein